MPRVFNQKIKILYLMRIFLEQTDEEHPMSVKELIAYLNSLGISAERKTVYDDIETLRNFGMDILNRSIHNIEKKSACPQLMHAGSYQYCNTHSRL